MLVEGHANPSPYPPCWRTGWGFLLQPSEVFDLTHMANKRAPFSPYFPHSSEFHRSWPGDPFTIFSCWPFPPSSTVAVVLQGWGVWGSPLPAPEACPLSWMVAPPPKTSTCRNEFLGSDVATDVWERMATTAAVSPAHELCRTDDSRLQWDH